MLRSMYSQPVRVNALNSVVNMTTLDDSTPSCPIFFAITKQVTVVAEPSITRIAVNSSFRNPIHTAMGRNIAQNPISLINAAVTAGPTFANAFRISNDAPIAINPIGVAIFPTLDTVLLKIWGVGSLKTDHINPAAIPNMIGLVIIPVQVLLITNQIGRAHV